MSGIGSVTFETIKRESQSASFDESVTGMLFDYGFRQNTFDDFPLANNFFGNGETVLINNLQEAESYGITDGLMNGVPHYHIKKYYDYVGGNTKLYVTFARCTNGLEPDFEIVEDIQQRLGGALFQLGIWTEQYIWKKADGVDETYDFTNLLGNIQGHLDNLSGSGKSDNESFPYSVILFPNTSFAYGEPGTSFTIDKNKIPDATELGFGGISVILGQNGDDTVHDIQKNNITRCPVGMMGYAMAILNLASAEMSVGSVLDFDLNKNEDFLSPELGFGKLSDDINDRSPISEISRVRQNVLSQKGYIIPVSYKSKEAQYFLSNDQTLSMGDYSTISNNRIINKCKRIIRSVLLPKIKSSHFADTSTGEMSEAEKVSISSEILSKMDDFLVNKKNQSQIYGRSVSVSSTSDFLDTDAISVSCTLVSKLSSSEINFRDEYYTYE